ncbi:11-beta-hydroxysteroid dehydrogenase A-like [Populus nigra]|uniref:11-beta-hydroxysteroid dehydrogenase A-like n=1 Tax=Populus nigra TaxID=3691 RepID=UPI002B27B359|nr:11-beta-hydroxysteroid dehydrogenase A-like [Populus nigra]
MDLIHKVLNIVLPPITLILLLLFLPSFLVSKFISRIKRSINSEKVAGKVVLITGASSGIGEYLAYEYARRGACLALAARRQERLRAVADKARALGSPDVIVIPTDISKAEDSERFINEAVNHFGKLDHLVNNAGVVQIDMFEDCKQISDFATLTNTNFWGSVYTTHFAIPHLRKSKGRIVGISSIAGWFTVPRMSFYCASKAAITSFYETLRAEFGSDIGITIVTPGVVESEMSQGDFLSKAQIDFVPAESTERCAKAIVDSACRGDRYLTEPSWARMTFLLKVLCPEVLEWLFHMVLVSKSSKKSN